MFDSFPNTSSPVHEYGPLVTVILLNCLLVTAKISSFTNAKET